MSDQLIQFARVLAAMALGGLIGWERQAAQKAAGLRTHMLTAGAAALLVLVGRQAISLYDRQLEPGSLRADPIGVIEAVITGVSFLGAGTIIRSHDQTVEGLTTAASLLFTAGIGIAVAVQAWTLALGSTLLALCVLHALPRVEPPSGREAHRDSADSRHG